VPPTTHPETSGRKAFKYSRTINPSVSGSVADGIVADDWLCMGSFSLSGIVPGLAADAALARQVMQFHAQLLRRVVSASRRLKQLVGRGKASLFHANLHSVEVPNVGNQGIPHPFGLSGGQLLAVHARLRYVYICTVTTRQVNGYEIGNSRFARPTSPAFERR
jgi:hypothetical protein